MGEKKFVKKLLKDLGEDLKVKWDDKSIKKANYLPSIILNRFRDAISNGNYDSAKKIYENYSLLEKACTNIDLFFSEEVRKDFLNQKTIFEKLENLGYFELNGNGKRAYE